ncbi:WXG100 family type VII secretion target [Streptomyces sp. NPDC048639]|uniref:WXG100 family type VII secretion target n=1 Tax=Streptomyces sp. NPDC048639 TaxID=3365581 RepID=UPI00371DF076
MGQGTDVDGEALRKYAAVLEGAAGRVEAIRNRVKGLDLSAEPFGKLSESNALKADYDTQSQEAEQDLQDVSEALQGISKGINLSAAAYDETEDAHTRLFGGAGR